MLTQEGGTVLRLDESVPRQQGCQTSTLVCPGKESRLAGVREGSWSLFRNINWLPFYHYLESQAGHSIFSLLWQRGTVWNGPPFIIHTYMHNQKHLEVHLHRCKRTGNTPGFLNYVWNSYQNSKSVSIILLGLFLGCSRSHLLLESWISSCA